MAAFNPSKAQENAGGGTVPPGRYVVRILQWTFGENKNTTPFFRMQFQVIGGPQSRSTFAAQLYTNEKSQFRFGQLVEAMGYDDDVEIHLNQQQWPGNDQRWVEANIANINRMLGHVFVVTTSLRDEKYVNLEDFSKLQSNEKDLAKYSKDAEFIPPKVKPQQQQQPQGGGGYDRGEYDQGGDERGGQGSEIPGQEEDEEIPF